MLIQLLKSSYKRIDMAKLCRFCGAPLTPETKFCSKCGKQIIRMQTIKSGDFSPEPVCKDKNKKIGIIALVIVFLVLGSCTTLYFTLFRGENVKEKAEQTYEAEQTGTILDYARKLEKAGNHQAAEAVYSLIPKRIGSELIKKEKAKIPPMQAQEELENLDNIFDSREGGKSK